MASVPATSPRGGVPWAAAVRRATRRVAASPLARVVGRRTLQTVPVLLGVSFITFCLLTLLPGTAANALLPENATAQQVHALEHQLGLDKPFVVQYLDWLRDVIHGDFGASLGSQQPVSDILGQRLPVSIELIVLAFALSLAFAVPVALLGARRPGGIVDRLNVVAGMVGLSMPMFVLGLVLVLVFAVDLRVLPAQGFVPLGESLWRNLQHMVLPSATIAFPLFCHYTRVLRADIVDQMNSGEYVVTARSKGVGPWRILTRHAFRNAIFPTLTLVGLNLGTMIGATVIVEQIFGLPGIGQALVTGIDTQDIEVVIAIVLILSLTVVVANLLTDILIALLDPRIRHGRSHG
ncbi:MAG TPA: ABC transporter permease [Solirubrobacteraceae bacterium]|nr:ABC transporter permease [Solirubrobacteraceae bacterium]